MAIQKNQAHPGIGSLRKVFQGVLAGSLLLGGLLVARRFGHPAFWSPGVLVGGGLGVLDADAAVHGPGLPGNVGRGRGG